MGKSILGDVFDKYHGICQYCRKPIQSRRDAICHHHVNREDGGSNALSNFRLRHEKCEKEAHKLFVHGNPEEGYKEEVFASRNRKKGYALFINGKLVRVNYPNKTTDRQQPQRSRFNLRRALN